MRGLWRRHALWRRRCGWRDRRRQTLALQPCQFAANPLPSVAFVDGAPVPIVLVALRQRTGQLVQPVKFDIDGVVAKTVHDVLAHQCDGRDGHRDNPQQHGNEEPVANGELQCVNPPVLENDECITGPACV